MTSLGIPASTANEGIPLSARRRHGWIGINEKSIPRAFGNERSMHTMARAFLQTLTGTLRSNRYVSNSNSLLWNVQNYNTNLTSLKLVLLVSRSAHTRRGQLLKMSVLCNCVLCLWACAR